MCGTIGAEEFDNPTGLAADDDRLNALVEYCSEGCSLLRLLRLVEIYEEGRIDDRWPFPFGGSRETLVKTDRNID